MPENMVVGRGDKKSKAPRWQFVVGLVVVVVLALVAGVVVRQIINPNENPEDTKTALPPELQEVQDLALSGNQEEADKKIQESLDDPSTSAESKFLLYCQQGANYYEKGEYQKALDSYTNASEINDTFSIAQAMAAASEKLGDNERAIKYLQHAIEIMPADNPIREDDIQMIEMQIKLLESGE